MSEHTKGKMTIIEHSWSDTGLYVDGNKIALISIESEATEENQEQLEQVASANARRVAAAWNVCEGIDTELLETGATLADICERSNGYVIELNAARALLREVMSDADGNIAAIRDCVTGPIRAYLDACDKPGEPDASRMEPHTAIPRSHQRLANSPSDTFSCGRCHQFCSILGRKLVAKDGNRRTYACAQCAGVAK